MNKTLKILFNNFEAQKIGEESQTCFNLLYKAIKNSCTLTNQLKIDDALGDYVLAREAEAFTAGFNSAIQLLIASND